MTPNIGEYEGWKIYMYFKDHNPPHIHFIKQGKEVVYDLKGNYLQGDTGQINAKKVQQYLLKNQEKLEHNWKNASTGENNFYKLD